jgi:hypothetical protein
MMDLDAKARFARQLTHALHQAPENPELFANILSKLVGTAGLHITELAITTGDLTTRLHEQLRDARRDAPPTYQNLLDMASAKVSLGRHPDRALADVLGVSTKTIQNQKHVGRIPRAWLEKIRALPDFDETRAQFEEEARRVIEILAENGYTSEKIRNAFGQIRTSRAGLGQIEKIVHGEAGRFDADELARMECELFGDRPNAKERFRVWLSTHLRGDTGVIADPVRFCNPKQVEKLRIRHKREMDFRESDPAYRVVSSVCELLERPPRVNTRSQLADPRADAYRLQSLLRQLFGDGADDRSSRRLAQLTGLDDRHTLDLIKGANAVNSAWWDFLDKVEAKVHPKPPEVLSTKEPELLRRMVEG